MEVECLQGRVHLQCRCNRDGGSVADGIAAEEELLRSGVGRQLLREPPNAPSVQVVQADTGAGERELRLVIQPPFLLLPVRLASFASRGVTVAAETH